MFARITLYERSNQRESYLVLRRETAFLVSMAVSSWFAMTSVMLLVDRMLWDEHKHHGQENGSTIPIPQDLSYVHDPPNARFAILYCILVLAAARSKETALVDWT